MSDSFDDLCWKRLEEAMKAAGRAFEASIECMTGPGLEASGLGCTITNNNGDIVINGRVRSLRVNGVQIMQDRP